MYLSFYLICIQDATVTGNGDFQGGPVVNIKQLMLKYMMLRLEIYKRISSKIKVTKNEVSFMVNLKTN